MTGSFSFGLAGLNAGCDSEGKTEARDPVALNKKLDPLGIFLASHNQDTGMKEWDIDRCPGE